MSGSAFRTVAVNQELMLDGFVRDGERMLRAADGRHLWIMNPPTVRQWTSTRRLVSEVPAPWSITSQDRGVVLRCAAGCAGRVEVDLVEMGPDAAAALRSDDSEPMLVLGSFAPLSSPGSLGRFLVGGEVLDTTDFDGHRVISEQTALSLYRIARRRGGPFWDLMAAHLVAVVAGRVAAATPGRLVHDMWGESESHARFVADAALLLLAAAERDPGTADLEAASRQAIELLEGFARPWRAGTWYAHDSTEVDRGGTDLVLNTHLQAMVVLMAAGRDVDAPLRALRSVLATVPGGARGWLVGYGLLVANELRVVHGRIGETIGRRLDRAAVGAQQRHSRLVHPGGLIARDASGRAAPAYYLTVNLNDLAAVVANAPGEDALERSLARGLRFARWGFSRLERGQSIPTAALVPNILRISGDASGAGRAVEGLRRRGVAPAIGWPGYEDHLWARLRAGTP